MPAVQRELAALHFAPHHGVVHQPLQLQHDRALLGAAHRLGAGLHGQQRFRGQLEPGLQRHGFLGHTFVGGANGAAMAVAADDDALHMQRQHCVLNRGHGAVQAMRAVIGRNESAHVAHDEQLARAGASQQIGHHARVRAADEQRLGVLALGHQVLKALLVQGKVIGLKTPQTQQQLVGGVFAHCTRGESAPSSSIPSTSAWPTSSVMYWCSARARDCMVSSAAMRSRTSS